MPISAHIVGWGYYLPQRRLENSELEARLDTSDEWIRSHTGIGERRIAGDGESTASMAIEAAKRALQVALVDPLRIDLIIVATISPEYIFPATACLVQDAIGASGAAAFDISAGCTGFVYALSIAEQAIRAGNVRTALVIGAETLSRFVDWEDRHTCILFGDGAGAVVLKGADMPGGILATHLGADGSGAELLYIPAGGARHPACEETLAKRQHYIQMDGRDVYRFAIRAMAQSTRAICAKLDLDVSDISLLIPHQANARITAAAAHALGLPPERVMETVEWCGNTSAASIPIALTKALASGRIKVGDLVVLVGFGAGLTWGAVAVRWDDVPTAPPGWWRTRWHHTLSRWAAVRSRGRRLWRRLRAFLRDRLYRSGHEEAD
ncbi:MAG: beta-ketoacyl-ACP synthase III [Anaerolineae bacterium]